MKIYTLGAGTIDGIDYKDNQFVLTTEGNKVRIRFQGESTPFIETDLSNLLNGTNAFASMAAFIVFWNANFAAGGGGTVVIDDTGGVDVNPISGQVGVAAGAGAVNSTTQRMTLASDDPAVALLRTLPVMYGEPFTSPIDFTVAYTSAVTLTATGAPFDIDDTVNYTAIIVVKNVSGVVTKYISGHNGVSISATSNVITLIGAGASPFTATDIAYRVVVLSQRKGYDASTDTEKVTEQSPLSEKYVQDSIVDTTNTAAATTYFPSSTGMSMDGFKDMSLTGQFITTGTLTFAVEASNDEDTTNANWIQIYAFDTKNNLSTNVLTVTNTTTTFAWDFDELNYSNFRIRVIDSSSTNTYIVKMRRKAL